MHLGRQANIPLLLPFARAANAEVSLPASNVVRTSIGNVTDSTAGLSEQLNHRVEATIRRINDLL